MEDLSNNTASQQGNEEYSAIPALPEDTVTAMAYIPFQTDTRQYSPDRALENGTLFVDLNKPFLGGKCK